jgi:hypothetical protein
MARRPSEKAKEKKRAAKLDKLVAEFKLVEHHPESLEAFLRRQVEQDWPPLWTIIAVAYGEKKNPYPGGNGLGFPKQEKLSKEEEDHRDRVKARAAQLINPKLAGMAADVKGMRLQKWNGKGARGVAVGREDMR